MAMSSYLRTLRAQVGNMRLLMPSVSAVVRDNAGRIVLVQQVDDGRWSTPGGSIELGESPADAVVREALEETGLLVTPTRIVAVFGGPDFVVRYPNGDETQYVSTAFECVIRGGELRAGDDEVCAARFWALEEARKLSLSPWLERVLPPLYEQERVPWFAPAHDRARAAPRPDQR